MQLVVSDASKSKRQPFFHVAIVVKNIWQVTTYSKIFSSGYHHLILGETTILPASHATLGLQHGSFRVTHSWNGKDLRPGVPFYGFMENVC
jgi:hypothetical protein